MANNKLKDLMNSIPAELGDLKDSNDNAVITRTAAFLTRALKEALSAIGKQPPKKADFARLIRLAEESGLLGPAAAADLNRICEIRNAFTHTGEEPTFNDPLIADEVNKLTARDRFVIPGGRYQTRIDPDYIDLILSQNHNGKIPRTLFLHMDNRLVHESA
jgi:hypothetical protein